MQEMKGKGPYRQYKSANKSTLNRGLTKMGIEAIKRGGVSLKSDRDSGDEEELHRAEI
jgi:hypothetical protein